MAEGHEGEPTPRTRCERPGCDHEIDGHVLIMTGRTEEDDGSQIAERGACNDPHCGCPRFLSAELPIDTAEPMALQSRHALMLGELFGLLTYYYPVDMRELGSVETLRYDLGEHADLDLPADDGVYYFVYIDTDDGLQETQTAVQAAINALSEPAAEEAFQPTADTVRAELDELAKGLVGEKPMEAKAFREAARRLEKQLWDAAVGAAHDQAADAATWLEHAQALARWGLMPMLIKEGEVRGFVAGLAAKAGRAAVEKIRYYRGLLPK
jgi:hypothetical protein